jgi:hypothetical protein
MQPVDPATDPIELKARPQYHGRAFLLRAVTLSRTQNTDT